MKENYYDILEINKNASPEIVEKAYKTLVKKYHPDLQEGSLKKIYENKLKLINEAYEVLSSEEKRKEYNLKLEQEEITNAEKGNINKGYSNTSNENQNYNSYQRQPSNPSKNRYEREYNEQLNNAINKAYYDAYIQSLKKRGFRIKYKKTFKDYFRGFVSIIIFIFIIYILWHIPFIKNYFVDLYNDNSIIHATVDVFRHIFASFTNK